MSQHNWELTQNTLTCYWSNKFQSLRNPIESFRSCGSEANSRRKIFPKSRVTHLWSCGDFADLSHWPKKPKNIRNFLFPWILLLILVSIESTDRSASNESTSMKAFLLSKNRCLKFQEKILTIFLCVFFLHFSESFLETSSCFFWNLKIFMLIRRTSIMAPKLCVFFSSSAVAAFFDSMYKDSLFRVCGYRNRVFQLLEPLPSNFGREGKESRCERKREKERSQTNFFLRDLISKL